MVFDTSLKVRGVWARQWLRVRGGRWGRVRVEGKRVSIRAGRASAFGFDVGALRQRRRPARTPSKWSQWTQTGMCGSGLVSGCFASSEPGPVGSWCEVRSSARAHGTPASQVVIGPCGQVGSSAVGGPPAAMHWGSASMDL